MPRKNKEIEEPKEKKRKLTPQELQDIAVDKRFLKPKQEIKREIKKKDYEKNIERYEQFRHPVILDKKDFKIDSKTFYIKHKDWKTSILGGSTHAESVTIIHRYIEQCKIPDPINRDFSFVHLAPEPID